MSKFINRLVLGTVQFGMDYGINNERGKIPVNEVLNILKLAKENGINTIDTAYGYGESEQILGNIFNSQNDLCFNIISKFPKTNDASTINGCFHKSKEKLKTKKLFGYLAHDTDSIIQNPTLWDEVIKLKQKQLVKKIGISVYFPRQAEWFLERNLPFDIIQLPYNILDNRFLYLFEELKIKNVEIHVRSVFLQGLFYKSINTLSTHFDSIKGKLIKLNEIANSNNIPMNSLLLCYVLLNLNVEKVVIGIDSINNLKDNIKALEWIDKVSTIRSILEDFYIDDENILLPFNWIKP